MRTQPTPKPVQLPLPISVSLPYMGDTRSCHHWDIQKTTDDYEEVFNHWRYTHEVEVTQ